MEMFLVALLKPFMAFAMLVPAWFVKRWMERNMREGRLKTLLLKRRGDAMQAWFDRQDARLIAGVKGITSRLTFRRR